MAVSHVVLGGEIAMTDVAHNASGVVVRVPADDVIVPRGQPPLADTAVAELNGVVPPTCTALAEIEVRLGQIEEIFNNHQKPILDLADLAQEYVDHAQTISRQDVAKTRGRPEGGIARAVRQLPLPGKTDAARKKRLERLLQIASLSPTVRTAALKACVAHFQSDLLEIAKAETEEDQLQKVSDIVARNHERALALKKRTAGEKQLRALIRYPAERKREIEEALAQFGENHAVLVEPLN